MISGLTGAPSAVMRSPRLVAVLIGLGKLEPGPAAGLVHRRHGRKWLLILVALVERAAEVRADVLAETVAPRLIEERCDPCGSLVGIGRPCLVFARVPTWLQRLDIAMGQQGVYQVVRVVGGEDSRQGRVEFARQLQHEALRTHFQTQ